MSAPEESVEKRAFEIGWEFVQEYYTIMHHEPESLYKFYGNNSYFCYGLEGESTPYCHGKDEIRKRIGDIDYKECRVVVSNVDSQPSNNGGIIVQVLGEMLNKDEQAIKFAQTFFLAEQQNGYYVLNDIFRNLKDEVNEECEELMQQAEEEKEEEIKEEPVKVEEPTKPEKTEVKETKPEKVEETKAAPVKEKKPHETAANKSQVKSQAAKSQAAPAQKSAPAKEATPAAKENASEASKPYAAKAAAATTDKSAANAASTTTTTTNTTTTASRPPMSYSSIASSNPTSGTKPAWNKVAAQGDGSKASIVVKQTVSSSSQKHQDNRNNNNNNNNQDKDSHTVFIKLPFTISKDEISNALNKYGDIKNIEINGQKNYAFVEFATVEQARKAVQEGEFTVKNTKINIEERKRTNKNHGNGRMNSSYNRGGRPDYNRNYSGGSRGSNDSNNMGNRRGGSNNGKRPPYKN